MSEIEKLSNIALDLARVASLVVEMKAKIAALQAERDELRAEIDGIADRSYRNGFLAGWNAAERGDEDLLRHVKVFRAALEAKDE